MTEARVRPVAIVGLVLLAVWMAGALWLNAGQATAMLAQAGTPWSVPAFAATAFTLDRPLLPTPVQLVGELVRTVFGYAPTDPRSVLYHVVVTGETAVTGFVLGALIGMALAVGIVHGRVLDASLMPWIIASQTVPILAIAPMAVVILGNMGLTGLLPKAVICAYLSFFPVAIGMVKGLRSADRFVLELMRTYSADARQVFWRVRLPAAMPYLFASLKVAVAVSTVGAIVAELPTGGTAGLGARLLTGSYYGQTLQIWGALAMAAALSLALVATTGVAERVMLRRRGLR